MEPMIERWSAISVGVGGGAITAACCSARGAYRRRNAADLRRADAQAIAWWRYMKCDRAAASKSVGPAAAETQNVS